jgi:hypothetical protein
MLQLAPGLMPLAVSEATKAAAVCRPSAGRDRLVCGSLAFKALLLFKAWLYMTLVQGAIVVHVHCPHKEHLRHLWKVCERSAAVDSRLVNVPVSASNSTYVHRDF